MLKNCDPAEQKQMLWTEILQYLLLPSDGEISLYHQRWDVMSFPFITAEIHSLGTARKPLPLTLLTIAFRVLQFWSPCFLPRCSSLSLLFFPLHSFYLQRPAFGCFLHTVSISWPWSWILEQPRSISSNASPKLTFPKSFHDFLHLHPCSSALPG